MELYLFLVLIPYILCLIAQFGVQLTFSKYSKIHCESGLTGAQTASLLLQRNDITNVSVEPIRGKLTDNYSPLNLKVNLSEPVYGYPTISAVGVAAHETGHAIQHAKGYFPLRFRSALVPVANIGSNAGPLLAIGGLIFSLHMLVNIGLVLFFFAILFYFVTLPVEFNASHRALKILKENDVLSKKELRGVRSVLFAAAMTYLTSAIMALGNFLRFFILTKRDD